MNLKFQRKYTVTRVYSTIARLLVGNSHTVRPTIPIGINLFKGKMITARRATRGGHLLIPENFKTLHSNFEICRNFQRIKMEFGVLII